MRIRTKLVIGIIIYLSLVQSFLIFRNGYYDQTDSGLSNLVLPTQLLNSINLWNWNYYTGYEASNVNTPPLVALELADWLTITLFTPVLGSEVFYGLAMAIGSISMFFLVDDLLVGIPSGVRTCIGFFAVFLFSFYFYPQFGVSHNLAPVFLATSFFFILRCYKKSEEGTIKLKDIAITALVIGFLIGNGGIAYLIPNLILIIIVLFFLLVFSNEKKRFFVGALTFIVVAFLLNITLFMSAYLFVYNHGSLFFGNSSMAVTNSANILSNWNREDTFSALQIYGVLGEQSIMTLYDNNALPMSIAQLSIVLIGVISIIYIFLSKKGTEKTPLVIGILFALDVIIFLYNNFSPPFGFIFTYLLKFTSILLIFRQSDPVFYYSIFFIESLLFAIGLGVLVKIAPRKLGYLILIGAAVIIMVHLYYFDYLPLASSTTFQIPQYASQSASYINNQSGNFNVGLLPTEFPFGNYATYYYGTDIYAYLIHNPVFTGGYVASGGEIAPINATDEYFNTASLIQKDSNLSSANRSNIAKILGFYGIKYLIVQGDEAPNGSQASYLIYNYSQIYENLNTTQGIVFLKRFNTTSIYEDEDYLPLIWASGNVTVSYATTPAGYVRVNITNASKPYTLYFRETYDPNWVVKNLSSGKELGAHGNYSDMNEWQMPSGDRTILIEYPYNNVIIDGWMFSIGLLVLCIAIVMEIKLGIPNFLRRA